MEASISSEINNFLNQEKGNVGSTLEDYVISYIHFDVPNGLREESNLMRLVDVTNTSDESQVILDEDGDIVIKRVSGSKNNVEARLLLEHQNTTNLANVGRQLWRGALCLADYLFELFDKNMIDEFGNDEAWLEIGAGTGLLAIVSYIVKQKQNSTASHIFVTDLVDVLPLTKSNVKRNLVETSDNLSFVSLDVTENKIPKGIFNEKISLLLAADVIYDDSITDGIIKTLQSLITQQHNLKAMKTRRLLTCLFSIEKRINFTIHNLNACAPAFDYFIDRLEELDKKLQQFNVKLSISYITLDEKNQWFCYERCKDVVIVKIDVLRSFES